jgi:Bifunctional DNA primase/polymerase, N-terminal
MSHWWSDASLLDSALAYAGQAIPVVPLHHPAVSGTRWRQRWSTIGCSCGQPGCQQPSEHPLTAGGLAEASTDSAQVRAWWQHHPQANVGMATGVVFDVLDADAATGRTAARRLEALAAPLGPLARTGSGRWHFYTVATGLTDNRIPRGTGVANQVVWHGRGGYVVAAPSRHVSGAPTRWLRALTLPLPEVQPLLHELLAARGQHAPPAQAVGLATR